MPAAPAASRGLRDAASDFLGDHRNRNAAAISAIFGERPAKVALALGLDRFLERVQVEDERVGTDHRDRAAAMSRPVTVVELDRAEVGRSRNRRRHVAHLEARGLRRIFERLCAASRRPSATPRDSRASAEVAD
jgi:hypothetical protein